MNNTTTGTVRRCNHLLLLVHAATTTTTSVFVRSLTVLLIIRRHDGVITAINIIIFGCLLILLLTIVSLYLRLNAILWSQRIHNSVVVGSIMLGFHKGRQRCNRRRIIFLLVSIRQTVIIRRRMGRRLVIVLVVHHLTHTRIKIVITVVRIVPIIVISFLALVHGRTTNWTWIGAVITAVIQRWMMGATTWCT